MRRPCYSLSSKAKQPCHGSILLSYEAVLIWKCNVCCFAITVLYDEGDLIIIDVAIGQRSPFKGWAWSEHKHPRRTTSVQSTVPALPPFVYWICTCVKGIRVTTFVSVLFRTCIAITYHDKSSGATSRQTAPTLSLIIRTLTSERIRVL